MVWLPAAAPGTNIRPAGEDFARGDVVLPAGKRLLPQGFRPCRLGRLSALTVRRRPRVVLFATGDEVCEPGCDRGPESTVNSNMYTLFGLVRGLGCEPVYLGILPDRPAELTAALARAAESRPDAIMTSGGVSVGEEDHVKAAVEALGRCISGGSPSAPAGRWPSAASAPFPSSACPAIRWRPWSPS